MALLRESGFAYSHNAKGSHEKWVHPVRGVAILLPRNLYSRHTANGILKDAGIQKKF